MAEQTTASQERQKRQLQRQIGETRDSLSTQWNKYKIEQNKSTRQSPVCFWWMHRISSRQDAMLDEVHEMTKRVEKLSQAEHDLISEVYPQVNEIKEEVQNVTEVVSPEKT